MKKSYLTQESDEKNQNFSELSEPTEFNQHSYVPRKAKPPLAKGVYESQMPHHQNQPTDYSQSQVPKRSSRPLQYKPSNLNRESRSSSKRQSRHQHQGPQDYLIWSIMNIFINVIVALPALFFSVQTRDMKEIGNYQKAKYYSKRSLILNIVASVTGLIGITLAILFRFALYHLFVQIDINSENVPLTSG